MLSDHEPFGCLSAGSLSQATHVETAALWCPAKPWRAAEMKSWAWLPELQTDGSVKQKSTAHAGILLYLWWEAPGNLTEPQIQQDAAGMCFILPVWSYLKRKLVSF